MGNPSNAVADHDNSPNNYLMVKPEFTMSYSRDNGRPNWVSWHLSDEWFGTLARVDTFRADPAVPADWYRVTHLDYSGSGFDRGHMTPNADRDKETSIPINQATFLMSNMIPQAPDNNQGPWANMENALRDIAGSTRELYIVAGGAGSGGTGSNGAATTIANGHIAVPASTWKVVLVLEKGQDDVSRVTCATQTIAVVMPNVQGIRATDWHNYITTVDAVEALTGYDFFSNVDPAVQACIEAGTNGVNPPGAADATFNTDEDTPVNVAMTALPSSNAPLTYTVVSGPSHGTLSPGAGAADRVYTPDANFHGSDSFTFNVSDGTRTSRTATVSLLVADVNDAPVANEDAAAVVEDSSDNVIEVLTGAGADTDADGDTLLVSSVGAASHGTAALNGGSVSYTPAANYNGTDSFTYTVSDGHGGTATGTVNVTVSAVNDAPSISNVPASATIPELTAYAFTASGADVDGDTLTFSLIGAPAGATINSTTGQFNWTPNEAQGGTGVPFSFTVRVSDGTSNADSPVTLTVTEVNQAPTLAPIGGQTVLLGGTLTFTASGSDADVPAQALTYSLTGAAPAGASINATTGAFSWTPAPAQAGQVYTFNVRVTDDGAGQLYAEQPVTVAAGYTWSGFLQPINQDGSSLFHLGQTVPVKFQLTGASAGITNAVARLYVAKITDNVVGTEESAGSTSEATEGNLFRYADGQYVFNLSTRGLTVGTYQLRVDTGDGIPRTVLVSLR